MKFTYLAAPVAMHGTKKYAEAQLRIAAYFPDHALIAGVFHTSKAWLELWPELQRFIDIGIVLRARDNSVGRGVFQEITDIQDGTRNCYLLNDAPVHPSREEALRAHRRWEELVPICHVATFTGRSTRARVTP
jgi:hypothetical protein